MTLPDFLDLQGVPYRLSTHRSTFTSQDLAAAEHVSGRKVVKPVVVEADGRFVLCALPACRKLDMSSLKQTLNAADVHLVEERTLNRLFPGCDLGAEPPIGNMYGLPTLLDESLIGAEEVTFQAGTHEDAVTMRFTDYRRVANARVEDISRPA
jgi:Ala-tRNA(Pro) deacylase